MTSKKRNDAFVIDTNVLAYNADAIFTFGRNDVYIDFRVILELDGLKKRNNETGFNARRASEYIENIGHGNRIGKDLGILYIVGISVKSIFNKSEEDEKKNFNDGMIIYTAIKLKRKNFFTRKYEKIVVITNDKNMRILARSLHIIAEDYEHDKTDKFERYGLINSDIESTNGIKSVRYNVLEKNDDGYRFKKITGFDNVEFLFYSENAIGIKPRNNEQHCALHALMDDSIQVVALTGDAGTAKTFLSLVAAMSEIMNMKYDGILVARPNIPISRYETGFKPGNSNDKLAEWMLPIADNVEVILSNAKTTKKKSSKSVSCDEPDSMDESILRSKTAQDLINKGILEIQPLESVRGRSLHNRFFIVDESQNLTPKDVKTIITRCAYGTKIVFTGDVSQIDDPYLNSRSNGLAYLIDKYIDQKNFCFIKLQQNFRSEIAEQGARLL